MASTQTFKTQLVGHDLAVELLSQQQQNARVPQSLLLTGPPNVGKGTVARYFAQLLNCQEADKPCGACLACRKSYSGSHPDLRILDDDGALKIDQIRELQRELTLSPYEGNYRVAIFCNFERATGSAANALLKTLEEPASQVVLILTATDPGALLPTIVSRCQQISLRPLPTNTVQEALTTRWNASPERAELLAQLSAGRLGWALQALDDEKLLERREQSIQELLMILLANRVDRLAYAQKMSRQPAIVKETMEVWLTIWRDMLLLQSGGQTKILNIDWLETLQKLQQKSTITQAKEMVVKLRTALINLERNVNPRLNLENVLLKMPQITGD
ncbi:MAG: DNA polymerase III subunit delta' [Chloroflexota bacterium]